LRPCARQPWGSHHKWRGREREGEREREEEREREKGGRKRERRERRERRKKEKKEREERGGKEGEEGERERGGREVQRVDQGERIAAKVVHVVAGERQQLIVRERVQHVVVVGVIEHGHHTLLQARHVLLPSTCVRVLFLVHKVVQTPVDLIKSLPTRSWRPSWVRPDDVFGRHDAFPREASIDRPG
jgi:ATP-dependent 26S proteasome regulatory subunit